MPEHDGAPAQDPAIAPPDAPPRSDDAGAVLEHCRAVPPAAAEYSPSPREVAVMQAMDPAGSEPEQPPERLRGFVKTLCEDFQVREITPSGEVCRLRELISYQQAKEDLSGELQRESGADLVPRCPEAWIIAADEKELQPHFAERDVAALKLFVNSAFAFAAQHRPAAEEERRPSDEIVKQGLQKAFCLAVGKFSAATDKTELKAQRTAAHGAVRKVLPFLLSDSVLISEAFVSQAGGREKAEQTERGVVVANAEATAGAEAGERQLRRWQAKRLKRVYIPDDLLVRVQPPLLDGDKLAAAASFTEEELGVIAPPEDAAAAEQATAADGVAASGGGAAEAVVRLLRFRLTPACIATILGRETRETSRNSASKWTPALPPYLHFSLYKCHRDTAEAIDSTAESLRIRPKNFSVAGTKDKFAITVQKVSLHKATIQQLTRALAWKSWDRGLKISDLSYSTERIALGDLAGNHFTIVLRGVPHEQLPSVHQLMRTLQLKGFVNFFGVQRFGTYFIKTHEVGAQILARNFRAAVRLILGDTAIALKHRAHTGPEPPEERPKQTAAPAGETGETEAGAEADGAGETEAADEESGGRRDAPERRYYERRETGGELYLRTGDAGEALRRLRPWNHVERTLLSFLEREPAGFVPALQQLPKNSLALYLHAAQSLLWNACAAERVRRFGQDRIVVGDLVVGKRPQSESASVSGTPSAGQLPPGGFAVDDGGGVDDPEEADLLGSASEEEEEGGGGSNPLLGGGGAPPAKRPRRERRPRAAAFEVLRVESEDMAAQYDITDLVLPLPAPNVLYPTNLTDFFAEQSLLLLGIPLDTFAAASATNPLLSSHCPLQPSYRRVVVKARDVKYRCIREKPTAEPDAPEAEAGAPGAEAEAPGAPEAEAEAPGAPAAEAPGAPAADAAGCSPEGGSPEERPAQPFWCRVEPGRPVPLIASDLDQLLGRPIAAYDTLTPRVSDAPVPPVDPGTLDRGSVELAEVYKTRFVWGPVISADDPEGSQPLENAAAEQLLPEAVVAFTCELPKSCYLTTALRAVLDASSLRGLAQSSLSKKRRTDARSADDSSRGGSRGGRGGARGGRGGARSGRGGGARARGSSTGRGGGGRGGRGGRGDIRR